MLNSIYTVFFPIFIQRISVTAKFYLTKCVKFSELKISIIQCLFNKNNAIIKIIAMGEILDSLTNYDVIFVEIWLPSF
jgi:hypothetical protein